MDKAAWWVTVHGVTKGLDSTEQLNPQSETQDALSMAGSSLYLSLTYSPKVYEFSD